MIPQAIVVALGLWTTASPAALDLGEGASNSAWIVGPVVASLGYVAAWSIARGLRSLNVPLGAWLALSPLVLDLGTAATVNAVLTGLAIVALSLLPSEVEAPYGGGWRSLWTEG